ncbi:host specificity factor TipJ family phage tail protein [Enterobacter sp. R1(2018)]|uniref:host specificity factor TipJ family phage tail protein n=1 Tax=Enterobacter sp. R1(2018) TaxID=2447891 RepID=UPI000EB5C487|nr:host specificity factor TipJ family phage tail protein [Enterobacter sp. R1(2018)]RKQ38555.1 MoaD/ThiS family protein [Enterobacter sp. R1(2018)]
MPVIEIQRVPGLPKQRMHASSGTGFREWLEAAGVHSDVRAIINGRELQDDDDVEFPIGTDDRIIIFDQPKSGDLAKTLLNPLEHFNPIKFTQKVMSSFIKQPNATGAAGQSKTSPNNSLKGQTNIARNGEARPDNYGLIRAYPDLLQQPIFEYVSNKKEVTQYMNFGLGKYDISQVRYSESSVGSMAGASYSIQQPGDVIPTLYEGYEFDDVDGQEVPGKNEDTGTPLYTATATTMVSGNYAGGQLAVKIVKQPTFDYFIGLTFPHAVSMVLNITYPVPGGSKTEDVTLFANLISAVQTSDGAVVNPTFWYTFTFNNLNGSSASYITTATINTTKFILNDNAALIVGPFFSPIDSDQLWVHTNSGLGGNSETNWQLQIWKVDSNNNQIPGTAQTFTYRQNTPHDSTSETFYRTDKITPTAGRGRYALSFNRTDNSSDASKLVVEEIHAINVRTNVSHPRDTTAIIKVRATENSTGRELKYNAMINRYTISYSLSTQSIDYTLRPSRRFADAVTHTWLVMGGQPETNIDLYGLYQIQAEIDAFDPRLGRFDYTFDDEDVSLGARIETICDAASVTVFWDDGVLSFVRDKKRTSPATVFNRNNTVEAGYSLSYDMTLPGGFDGVEVQYRNPSTNKQDFIRYRISNGAIVSGSPVKAKKFEMMYVRDAYQADERALRECRRLIYSRMAMSITALADGEWVNVGDMVQIADTYDVNQQTGYIISRSGNNFETSERINFNGQMYVMVTDYNGTPTARYPAQALEGTAFGFSAALPGIELNIFDGMNVQSPSRYFIASTEELDTTRWEITYKTPGSDGTTALTVREYSDLIYP